MSTASTPGRKGQSPDLAARLQQREQQQVDATEDTLSSLASVIQGTRKRLPPAALPLVSAVRVLGEESGIDVVTPRTMDPSWTHEQTLRAIERTSHFRTRRVMLDGNWWKKDCGPILGFAIDGSSPLALIPQEGRQYLRLDALTGTQSTVDEAVANSIQPFGYVLYRPLPEKIHRAIDVLRFSSRGMGREIRVLLTTALAGALSEMGSYKPRHAERVGIVICSVPERIASIAADSSTCLMPCVIPASRCLNPDSVSKACCISSVARPDGRLSGSDRS